MSQTQRLRDLPAVNEVLLHVTVDELRKEHSHARVAEWTRSSIQSCRESVLAGAVASEQSLLEWIVHDIVARKERESAKSLQSVINATGVVLHTNLGRSPLAERALDRVRMASRYTNVELDLESGRRSKRGAHVMQLLAQLTGAEAALVVNNCAAATVLVLQATAAGREVIVSRGQLVEIGGGFRLPEVFQSSGVRLREVGTTNRTYLRDYEAAINDQTGAIIRVHRSNFHLCGFVTEPSIDEMALIERPEDVIVIDDLGSGCINDLSEFGLHEPTVLESVRSGADVTLFSGDKLFGGPQAGILVGKERWIEKLRRNPLMRAVRVDKMTLAAMEATAELHLEGRAFTDIPTLNRIATSADVIQQRCHELKQKLTQAERLHVVECESQVGGGSIPGSSLPSFGLQIQVTEPDRLASELRGADSPIQGRVTDDAVLLDLRTVADEELPAMAAALNRILPGFAWLSGDDVRESETGSP